MTRHVRPAPVRLAAALLAAVALALGLLAAVPAAPAGAHDGDAVIDVEGVHPAGMSVHYIVRVTWQDDGHPATGATVTATGVAADGTQLTPVTLAPQDEDGRYSGVVDYPEPGNWTVRITAIEPTGTVEQAQVVSAPATTVPAESGDAGTGDEATDGTTDEGGFAPADDGTGPSSADDDGEAASSESSDDDGGMPIYLLVAAFVIVIVGAVTSVSVIRRNRPDLAGGPGGGPDAGDDGEGPGGGPAGGAPDATADDDPPASASTGGTASTS